MILEVQHETHLEYSEPVTESMTEVRMEPVSDGDQSCHSFHLVVWPGTEPFRYQDGFGNRVHHFNVLPPHDQVKVLAASIIETHPKTRDLLASRSVFPVDLDAAELEVLDFLKFRGPVRQTPRLTPLLEKLRPEPGSRVGEFVARVMEYIHENFKYARDVTLVSSPIDDVLEKGKGVCQDFTHLLIAVLRSNEAPVRYVSGYIHRPNKESQSHAWCEVWLPDVGWVGIDPTNDQVVDDHFVKVAFGRDFTDVPPNRGVYRGRGEENILVRVCSRALERLPAMSWQEQLPSLDVPLTSIVTRLQDLHKDEDEGQQQQQQQQ